MDKSRYESTDFSLKALEWINIFGLIAGIIAAAIIFFTEWEVFISVVLLLGSVIGFCILNVFLGIAKDIIAIRYAVEKGNAEEKENA